MNRPGSLGTSRFDRATAAVIAAFVLSRILYLILGVEFDVKALDYFDQFLDPVLLRENLLQSVYFLHTQPPGFNIYLGIVLKLAGPHHGIVFHLLSMLFSLTAAIAIHRTMLRFEVRRSIATPLTILFVVSPSVVLFENLLFYDLPLMALFAGSALFLHRFLRTRSWIDGTIFFSILMAAGMIRSMIHPLLLLACVGLLVLFRRSDWRRIIAAAALPLMLLLMLYVKNWILFGEFNASTWLASNVATMTVQKIPLEQREELIREGRMSRYVLLHDLFADLDSFRHLGLRMPPAQGIPALDQEIKSTGAPNNNHLAYIEISHQYGRDVAAAIGYAPKTYIMSIGKAAVAYFMPSTRVWLFRKNRDRIELIDRIFNHLFYGQVVYTQTDPNQVAPGSADALLTNFLGTGLFLFFGLPLLVLASVRRAWRSVRAEGIRQASASTITIFYMILMIVATTASGVLLSLGENARFRFPADPFFLILLALQLEIWRTTGRGPWWRKGEATQETM